ncbi:MAG: hypothetical protein S4CHLAM45_04680 [Chlamydiales bacterium]|nr:hypothetical protein [Chlamydiales bacterium]MCH9619320.1 hypothetical protein [Chlamydiales bacterium]MCH9622582.1 hypothetical protein [Chlamydiales bacterium]
MKRNLLLLLTLLCGTINASVNYSTYWINPTQPIHLKGEGDVFDTYKMKIISSISPPVISGVTLQACHVEIVGNEAIVGYNVQGEIHKGGVDVFNIKNLGNPTLVSRYLFDDAKVNFATLYQGKLFLALTHCTDEGCQAAVQTIDYKGSGSKDQAAIELFPLLSGPAAMHLLPISSSRLFALSGNSGCISLLSTSPALGLLSSLDLTDARWIGWRNNRDKSLYILQGTPGLLSVLDINKYDFTLRESYPVDGLELPEAKSTVALVDKLAFIAAGSAGVQILNLENGEIIKSIPLETIEGVDLADQMTTDLTINGNLIFTANAGAGVSVYMNKQRPFSRQNPNQPMDLSFGGRLQLGEGTSANHVALNKKYLFVASGKLGVKVIEISRI